MRPALWRRGLLSKLLLGVEIVAAYAQARWTLRRSGLPRAVERLRTVRAPAATQGDEDPVIAGRRLARAVARTLVLVPGDSRCLMRSLVLTRLLASRGIESELVLAVRPGEQLVAHAWLAHRGTALQPPGAPAFEQLVTL